jgi:ketopantoate hydroxymethyltransferase
VKRYADLGDAARAALEAYVSDVRSRKFPAAEHAYEMAEGEAERLAGTALSKR